MHSQLSENKCDLIVLMKGKREFRKRRLENRAFAERALTLKPKPQTLITEIRERRLEDGAFAERAHNAAAAGHHRERLDVHLCKT